MSRSVDFSVTQQLPRPVLLWVHKAVLGAHLLWTAVQAMVLAGGRGKGTFSNGFQGGVHVLDSDPAAIQELATNMLGFNLVTKQTPPEGVPVNKLMVAESLDIDHETYFAIVLDRESNGAVMVGSPEGGAYQYGHLQQYQQQPITPTPTLALTTRCYVHLGHLSLAQYNTHDAPGRVAAPHPSIPAAHSAVLRLTSQEWTLRRWLSPTRTPSSRR